MDKDGLPIVGAGIDLNNVASIQHKRMLAFLNHFISHTVSFLNKFSGVSEHKLSQLTTKINKLETSLLLLETKLNSIPGLQSATQATSADTRQPVPHQEETTQEQPVAGGLVEQPQHTEEEEKTGGLTVREDPRYSKFLKMMQVGVPLGALTQKVLLEGLDPSLLETPDALVPDAVLTVNTADSSESEMDDSDDFSD